MIIIIIIIIIASSYDNVHTFYQIVLEFEQLIKISKISKSYC